MKARTLILITVSVLAPKSFVSSVGCNLPKLHGKTKQVVSKPITR